MRASPPTAASRIKPCAAPADIPGTGPSHQELRLKHAPGLTDNLPVPVAVVTQAGETLDVNRALLELAERSGARPSLTELFGAAFGRVLARAWIERHIQSTAAVIVGPEPRATFRMSFASTGDDRTLGVVLQEVSAELEYRRVLAGRDRDFEVIRVAGVALSSLLDLDALCERTYAVTRDAIPCPSIYIAIYDREGHQISFPRYMEENAWKDESTRPFGNGLTEHLLRTRQPLLLNENVAEQAAALGIQPHGRPCQAWLGAPMVIDGEAIGVIALQDYATSGSFVQHDLEKLTIIAALAAAGIKNARSVAAERRAFRELSEAQARMLEAERLRGVTETVGALNHEVNNPLAAIVGNCQLVLKRGDVPVAALQKVESIQEAAKRIQRVTAKMESLIQACSMPYPGSAPILDVQRSVAIGDRCEVPHPDADAPPATGTDGR